MPKKFEKDLIIFPHASVRYSIFFYYKNTKKWKEVEAEEEEYASLQFGCIPDALAYIKETNRKRFKEKTFRIVQEDRYRKVVR